MVTFNNYTFRPQAGGFLLSTCGENVVNKGKLVENLIQIKIIPNKIIFYTLCHSLDLWSAIAMAVSFVKIRQQYVLHDEIDDKLTNFY